MGDKQQLSGVDGGKGTCVPPDKHGELVAMENLVSALRTSPCSVTLLGK